MAQRGYTDNYRYLCFANAGRRVYVTHLAELEPGGHYHWKKTRIARHLIDYIKSGRGYVEVRGIRYEVETGDLIYIKKDIPVNYGADENDPYGKLWFACDGALTDALCEIYLGGRELIILKNVTPDTWYALESELSGGIHDEEKIGHLLLDFFRSLGEHCREEKRTEAGLAEEIRKCLDSGEERYASLDGLAEYFHLSARHLSRVFRAHYGIPPIAYRCRKRLHDAARYLAETDFSVAEIAERTGYADQSRFSAAFKKHFGIYPTEYRRQNR